MNTLKLLFVALFAVAFVACSNPTDSEEEFEPYKNGTWLVTSPETAEWEGAQPSKQKSSISSSDTIFVTQPEQQHLYVEVDTADYADRGDFYVTFVDSSINKSIYADSVDSFQTYFPKVESSPMLVGGQRIKRTSTHMRVRLGSAYQCSSDKILPAFVFELIKGDHIDGEIFRIYHFDIEGFSETVKDIAC